MKLSIAENPAVTDPRRNLTKAQKEAIGAIAFYRHHSRRDGIWQIGAHRASSRTIIELSRMSLVQERGRSLTLTIAGKLAHDRLQENH